MKAKWLIEHEFCEDVTNLVKSCERLDYEYKILSDNIHGDIDFSELYDERDCVIFYGSLQMGALVNKKAKWIPSIYSNVAEYACTKYYPIFDEFILNRTYSMMPYGQILSSEDWLYEHLGIHDTIFIRPDGGFKSFTGKAVERRFFNKDVDYFGFYGIEPHELCVIAEPRNVANEWRFLVVDNKIVAGSQYRPLQRGLRDPEPYDNAAFKYAEHVLSKVDYKPDNAWMLDIFRTKQGDYYVLEVGCFSCAGLYKMDTDMVVKYVSEQAEKDWRDFYD